MAIEKFLGVRPRLSCVEPMVSGISAGVTVFICWLALLLLFLLISMLSIMRNWSIRHKDNYATFHITSGLHHTLWN